MQNRVFCADVMPGMTSGSADRVCFPEMRPPHLRNRPWWVGDCKQVGHETFEASGHGSKFCRRRNRMLAVHKATSQGVAPLEEHRWRVAAVLLWFEFS